MSDEIDSVRSTVLVPSNEVPSQYNDVVRGYDFNEWLEHGPNYDALFDSFARTGFQSSTFADAVKTVNKMLEWRPSAELQADLVAKGKDPNVRCKVYLGYTSNMVSCGVREIIRFLCQHKLVDVIVTTAGGIEEDFIKCLAPTLMGDFELDGATLRSQGINRIGNLLVPNNNYCLFENWVMPILDTMLAEQKATGQPWSPSTLIARLGKEINHHDSVYYWCWKNDIPVFCPAIIDGSLGDMIYFHATKTPGLIIDLVQDIQRINRSAVFAEQTGMVILGGGVIKHHICNANLMRNGADYAVYINTGQPFDGSDTGATPDEAVSWGKIRHNAKPIKVCGEASFLFPLLVSQTFMKHIGKDGSRQ